MSGLTDLFPVLRAPGYGLLTVSTGARRAERFLKKYFPRAARPWNPPAHLLEESRHPFLLGIPSDSGGGICRGAAHGPLALREKLYARDSSWARHDLGDIPCIPQLVHDSMLSERQKELSARALWQEAYTPRSAASPLNLAEDFLCELWSRFPSFRPLVLGGDHSVSGPVFEALSRTGKCHKLGVLHLDAHTDLLEERYGVVHCFGSWTSHAVQKLDNPSSWIQVGIRASGQSREYWESRYGVKQYWSREIRRKDPRKLAEEISQQWERNGCEAIYVTHDIDGTDGASVPATGTPEPLGLSPQWVVTFLKAVTRRWPLVGADLVEVAPVLGAPAGVQKTLRTAQRYLEALQWDAQVK